MYGGNDGADDVGGFDGCLSGGGKVDRVFFGEVVFQGSGVVRVAAPEVDGVDVSDEGNGFDMTFCLFTGADDGEGLCIFAGEYSGSEGAGGGGTDGGDGGGVEHQQGCAMCGFEEDDDAL